MCVACFGSFEGLDAVTRRKTSHSIVDSITGGIPQRREGVFRSTRRLAGRSLGAVVLSGEAFVLQAALWPQLIDDTQAKQPGVPRTARGGQEWLHDAQTCQVIPAIATTDSCTCNCVLTLELAPEFAPSPVPTSTLQAPAVVRRFHDT